MGFIDCASGASLWNGYDYFRDQRVNNLTHIGGDVFTATVAGTADQPYNVELHTEHPRKSKCNCPHADGRRIVCKHIVATYFTVFPQFAERFYADALAYETEQEKYEEAQTDRMHNCIHRMTKSELEQELLQLLYTGPEWQLARFLREHELDRDW